MSRRKLMIVIPGLDMGGAELQLTQQVKLFPEYDVTLTILSDRYHLLAHVSLPHQNVKIYNEATLRHLNSSGLLKALPVAWKMMMQCRSEKIRLVIAHLPMAHWTARWMVLFSYLFFFPIQLVAYHHSEQYKANPSEGLFQKLFTVFHSWLAYSSDTGNVFVSKKVEEDISRNQYVRNGVVIKNLVEEKHSDTVRAQEIIKQENRFQQYLVIPGRIERVKGQVFFIKSLTHVLIERIKSTKTLMVFAGGGSDEAELIKLIPEDLKGNVLVTGALEHSVLLSFLSLADLVIIPSLSEGFGNTLVESMMLKRNILSSNAGGLSETIRDSNAIEWFEAGNAEQLQQKMNAFFLDQLSFQPDRAYAYYRANFTPEVHRENMTQYLRQIWPA